MTTFLFCFTEAVSHLGNMKPLESLILLTEELATKEQAHGNKMTG